MSKSFKHTLLSLNESIMDVVYGKEALTEARKLYALVIDNETTDSIHTNKREAMATAQDLASEYDTVIEVVEFGDGSTVESGRTISRVKP